jgi:hypothetical protein
MRAVHVRDHVAAAAGHNPADAVLGEAAAEQRLRIRDDAGVTGVERETQSLRPREASDVAVAEIQAEQLRVVLGGPPLRARR